MAQTILVVDDNVTLLWSLKKALSGEYQVELARSAKVALQKLGKQNYECVLLDLGLPDMPGVDVCRRLRRNGSTVPVIVLSGDGAASQKAELLDAGADDYMTKPADIIELKARLRHVIRRTRLDQSLGSEIAIEGVRLDSLRHTVEREGKNITLRRKEFALLECLMNNAGKVVSRQALLRYGWDEGANVWTNVVDVHIKNLRDKLDLPFDRQLIVTVHGVGYKFDASNVADTDIIKGGKDGKQTTADRSS